MDEATRLKAARKSLGYSDREMAAAVGLRGTHAKDDYRKMETGARPVSGPALVAAECLAREAALKAAVERMEADWWGDGVNPYGGVLDLLEARP